MMTHSFKIYLVACILHCTRPNRRVILRDLAASLPLNGTFHSGIRRKKQKHGGMMQKRGAELPLRCSVWHFWKLISTTPSKGMLKKQQLHSSHVFHRNRLKPLTGPHGWKVRRGSQDARINQNMLIASRQGKKISQNIFRPIPWHLITKQWYMIGWCWVNL